MSYKEYSSPQVAMRNVSDPAVFTRNFQVRLDDAVRLEKVTHRANKPWRSAQIGIDRHGELPIYIKSRDEDRNVVTHVGTLEDVVVYPSENPKKAEQLREYVADRDTWNEHFDGADTLYLLNECQELTDPFCFTELRKIVNGESLPSSYSRQPAYVYQINSGHLQAGDTGRGNF